MIRFIIKRTWRDAASGAEGEYYETLLCDVPKLEERLRHSTGHGPNGYHYAHLVGVEVAVEDRS